MNRPAKNGCNIASNDTSICQGSLNCEGSFVRLGCTVKSTKKNPSIGERFSTDFFLKVEPQRIELWSREDNTALSTCLVDINFREQQGHQQPKLLLSHCVLAVFSNLTQSRFTERHRDTSIHKSKTLSDDGRGALSSTLSLNLT